MIGADRCLAFILYRVSPRGEEFPVIIWFRDRWAAFKDAWGALGLHDGASPARVHLVTSVAAQHRLGIFRFLFVERDA